MHLSLIYILDKNYKILFKTSSMLIGQGNIILLLAVYIYVILNY